MRKDIDTLLQFIHVFCTGKHPSKEKLPFLHSEIEQELSFCHTCYSLANYSISRRMQCLQKDLSCCRKCSPSCFQEEYRSPLAEVLRYAGLRYALRGRLDYIGKYLL